MICPPPRQPDCLSPCLRRVLAMSGIHDVRIYPLEGMARSEAEMERFRDRLSASAPSEILC